MNQVVLDRRRTDSIAPRADAPVVVHIDAVSDAGRLLLRVVLGGLLLLHGIAKVQGGLAPIMQMLTQSGWPSWMAYGAYLGEVVAPILLIAGVWTRPAALVAAFNMVVAVGLAHVGDLTRLGPQGGYALELQALYLFGAVSVALLGAGRFSVGRSGTYWN